MNLAEITRIAGPHKRAKRVGRGRGSGHGKTSSRGHKGARARAGCSIHPLSEGGQMPLFRRIPKRGFSNSQFRTEYSIVNVSSLQREFDSGAEVTKQAMADAGLIRSAQLPVKVLGDGSLEKGLLVEADRFSKSAREKISAAGGSVKVVSTASAGKRKVD